MLFGATTGTNLFGSTFSAIDINDMLLNFKMNFRKNHVFQLFSFRKKWHGDTQCNNLVTVVTNELFENLFRIQKDA